MEGQNENDELYPIAVLIDELKVRRCSATPSTYFLVQAHISMS